MSFFFVLFFSFPLLFCFLSFFFSLLPLSLSLLALLIFIFLFSLLPTESLLKGMGFVVLWEGIRICWER